MDELNSVQRFIKEFSRAYWLDELREKDAYSAEVKVLKNTVDRMLSVESGLKGDILALEKQIDVLSYKKNLVLYKKWFDENIKPVRRSYTFRGKSKPAHLHLRNFSNNSVLVEKYEKFLIEKFNLSQRSYSNPDTLVYQVSHFIHNYIKSFGKQKKYRTDAKVFKKNEYWATPEEIFDFYVNKNEAIDCDDTGTFIGLCITVALKYHGLWDEHSWRLKYLVVDVLTGFGHFMVGWLKNHKTEGVIGFIPIESTFYQNKFREVWINNLTLKNNILYQIRFSFDEKHEYEKIGKRK